MGWYGIVGGWYGTMGWLWDGMGGYRIVLDGMGWYGTARNG
jgi:hypothetical protein